MKKPLKDYFIPHDGNDYKPHSLQKAAILGMTLLVLLSFMATNIQSLLWISSDWLVSTILPAVIVDLTNEEREDAALSDLNRNSVLDAAATLKARHMAENQYFSHYSPDGISPWYWFGQANYNFVHAGENLAIHFSDSGEVVQAWMDSPTHRANIMNGNYTEIGVGTAEGRFEGFDTVFVVQLFGTPAAASASEAETSEPPVPQPAVASESASANESTSSSAEKEESSDESSVAETQEEEPNETNANDNEEVDVLAEAVAINETVEVVEAEPEPVMTEKVVTSTRSVDTSSTSEVADIEFTETGVAFYSDHLSTSTGGVPASVKPDSNTSNSAPGFFAELATQPHQLLQIMYTVIALFVLGSLLVSILVEIRHQHPVQLAYSIALLVLMFGLYKAHMMVTGGALVV